MIKKAKAGDVIFELNYNYRNKTCKIIEHVVIRDQVNSDYIHVEKNKSVYSWEAFKTYKKACKAYLLDLKADLKHANKVVATIIDILSKIEEPKGKIQAPYLGDPVWESKNEINLSLLNIKD